MAASRSGGAGGRCGMGLVTCGIRVSFPYFQLIARVAGTLGGRAIT